MTREVILIIFIAFVFPASGLEIVMPPSKPTNETFKNFCKNKYKGNDNALNPSKLVSQLKKDDLMNLIIDTGKDYKYKGPNPKTWKKYPATDKHIYDEETIE